MNQQQSEYLSSYFSKIKTLTNETQKKELFIILLVQLFPSKATEIQAFATGAENFVKYYTEIKNTKKTGFIDSFYGNLIIEFENSLTKTGLHAEDQLKEYTAKIWSRELIKSDYLCIASDCEEWIIYTPKLHRYKLTSNEISPGDVELVRNETFSANSKNSESFYLWLDRVLFRENSIPPVGSIICSEFGVNSPHFTKTFDGLSEIFNRAKGMKEVQVAFHNWKKYLQYTYGEINASEDLFLTHSYLSAFTKILMAEVLSAKKNISYRIEDIPDTLTGKFFYNLNIRNYVEKDFFYWINYKQFSHILNKLWEITFNLLKTYDFSKIDNDFLKDIYQGMVDPVDRHDLGEHYTPDWLCEKIILEALSANKNKFPTIADITCGSGSFLRVAIHALRNTTFSTKNSNPVDKNKLVAEISKSVIGFEIHPLACFIAKTNYMLALEDLLAGIDEPLYIPIYLCDSLLSSELDQLNLIEKDKFSIYLDEKKYIFPKIKALTDKRFDEIMDFIDHITHSYPNKEDLSDDKVEQLLITNFDQTLIEDTDNFDLLLQSFIGLTQALHEKVINHENTIWSFVIKNNFRPIAFNDSIDIVVGNPPWLTFKDVGAGLYRKELEYLGLTKYRIAPQSSKLRTHMELSTIFLAHAVDSYLKKNGKIYFVLPRSLFSADHHINFRDQTYTLDMKIDELWNLFDVSPLFRVPSCVVVASKNKNVPSATFDGRTFSGKLKEQNSNWDDVKELIVEKREKFHLIKMNKRSAISEASTVTQSTDNFYQKLFKQGATILPRSYYFIKYVGSIDSKKIIPIQTHESITKNSKAPYKGISLTGRANKELLFKTLLADNIMPFCNSSGYDLHLPIHEINKSWKFMSSQEMIAQGYTDSSIWFSEVEKSFTSLCKTGMSLHETLDYYGKLFIQDPTSKFWVLYCSSGTNLCSTVYINDSIFWADHKTYWYCPPTIEEAYYLAGILNSSTLNQIIKPFQSTGLLGERDIHKKILDVGIPRFEPGNISMLKVVNFAKNLSAEIQGNIKSFNAKVIGRRRAQVREKFEQEFIELDKIVMNLFVK